MDRSYKQEPPFAIQFELTQGCNLRCSFCGIAGITEKPMEFDFVTLETVNEFCDKLIASGWSVRLELAMHGEPTANPLWKQILSALRHKLGSKQHIMLTTNGFGFLFDEFRKRRDTAGIIDSVRWAKKYCNVVALDAYEYANLYTKIQAAIEGTVDFGWYPRDSDMNPHKRRAHWDHDFVFVQDISIATTGTHSNLNNHCGNAFPPNNKAAGKRCAKPFRELSIRYDGQVALCCNDWRGVYDCGNMADHDTLDELWNNEWFYAGRALLYQGDRNFGACKGCDATSYRLGLLPDKKGKLDHPFPCEEVEEIIVAAERAAPMTKIVKRPWEEM